MMQNYSVPTAKVSKLSLNYQATLMSSGEKSRPNVGKQGMISELKPREKSPSL
jgi:hypothetical protein